MKEVKLLEGLNNEKTVKILKWLNSSESLSLESFKKTFKEDAEKFLEEAGSWYEVDDRKDLIKLTKSGKEILEKYLEADPLSILLDVEDVQTFRVFDKYDVVGDVYLVLVYGLDNNYKYIPLIVTSKGDILQIKDHEKELLNRDEKGNISKEDKYFYFEYEINGRNYIFKLKNKPFFDERFEITNVSNGALRMLKNKAKVNKSELFDDIVNVIREYWDHSDDREYAIIASLIILSYIEKTLGKTIYLLLQGREDTGKSTLQKLISKLQLYGFFVTQSTIKVAVRYIDFYGCKLGFDDFDKLDPKVKSEVLGILNSGLYESGTYNIVDLNSRDIKKSITSFNTFGFKSFSTNNTKYFDSSFLSRCYSIVCVRQARKLKDIYDKETFEKDRGRFQSIIDRCFVYCLLNWKKIVDDIQKEKAKLEEEGVFGRTVDRNSTILGIVRHFKPEIYDNIRRLLEDKEGLGKKEELETVSGCLLWTIAELFKQKEVEEKEVLRVTNKKLVDKLQEVLKFDDKERRKFAISVANYLKRTYELLKKPDQVRKTGETTEYIIYKSDFLDIVKRFGYVEIYNTLRTESDVNISEMSEMSKLADNSDMLISNPKEKPKSETSKSSQATKDIPVDKQIDLLREIIQKLKKDNKNTIENITKEWNELSKNYDLVELDKLIIYLKNNFVIFEPKAGYYDFV